MTISFDGPDANVEKALGRGPRREMDSESCGGDVDWSRGLRGLPRTNSRSRDVSGSLLTKVIEGEIIPRLFLAHRNQQPTAKAAEKLEKPADIGNSDDFARLVLASEPSEIVDRVEALMARGIKLERIFLDLLAPVARKLGEFWEEDRCTFTDVTLGLARLHQVLHEISRRNGGGAFQSSVKRRAYFVPSPGEQHTFGLSMLEEFFLHAGWETASDHAADEAAILRTVREQKLDVIGFSVGCNEFLDPLSQLIKRTREASRNRDVTIMVGGRLFLENPHLAAKVSGATVITDGVHAVQTAEALVSRVRSGGIEKLM